MQEIKSVDSGPLQFHEISVSKNVPLKGFTLPCPFLSLFLRAFVTYSAEESKTESTKSWFRAWLRLRGVSSQAAIERSQWRLEELSRKVIGRKKENDSRNCFIHCLSLKVTWILDPLALGCFFFSSSNQGWLHLQHSNIAVAFGGWNILLFFKPSSSSRLARPGISTMHRLRNGFDSDAEHFMYQT